MKNTQKTTFIYALYDPLTNETRYIGKSNRPRGRYSQHMDLSKKRKSHKNSWIKSILNENRKPYYYILDEVPMNDWEYWEKYWIEQFTQWGFNLTNLTDGGEGAKGYSHTEETKQKMRELKLGGKLSEEHKKKISNSGKKYHEKNPSYNMKGENERVPMDRKLLYQKYITEDMSMPEISKLFDVSEKKIFDELHRYNIKKKDGWWLSKISKQYKKITLQYDLNGNLLKEWDGLIDIQRELGFDKGNISGCCLGKQKTSYGFIWKYK